MITIGVTGGIGSGKSAVTGILAEQGALVFSADQAARALLGPASPLLTQLAAHFGGQILLPDGALNRSALGKLVFTDPKARKLLDALTHPPILSLLRCQIDSARQDLRPDTVVVVEVPLLFETDVQSWFDCVIVVDAPDTLRVERICKRDGVSPAEAQARIDAQWPLAEKAARADIVIANNENMEALTRQTREVWRQLQTSADPLRCCRNKLARQVESSCNPKTIML